MSIEDSTETPYAIAGNDSLERVGRETARLMHFTPTNSERFVADWLAEWASRGLTGDDTVDRAQAATSDGLVWDRLCWWMSQYCSYHTNSQLADFVLFNLLRVTSKNVLRSFAVLADRTDDEATKRLLQAAREHVKALDGKELGDLLHELARPS